MKKKRRVRTAHPGVKILKRVRPSGTVVWLARWRERDPTGQKRWKEIGFSSLNVTNDRRRVAWAKRKARELQKAEEQFRSVRFSVEAPMEVEKAIADYLKRCGEKLRTSTLEGYTRSLGFFLDWCRLSEIKTLHDLDEYSLGRLRDWLQSRRKKTVDPEGGRGAHRATEATVGAVTANHDS